MSWIKAFCLREIDVYIFCNHALYFGICFNQRPHGEDFSWSLISMSNKVAVAHEKNIHYNYSFLTFVEACQSNKWALSGCINMAVGLMRPLVREDLMINMAVPRRVCYSCKLLTGP